MQWKWSWEWYQNNHDDTDDVQVLRCFTVMNDALGEWENSSLRRLNFVNCHVSVFFILNCLIFFYCHVSFTQLVLTFWNSECTSQQNELQLDQINESYFEWLSMIIIRQHYLFFQGGLLTTLQHCSKVSALLMFLLSSLSVDLSGRRKVLFHSLSFSGGIWF